MRLDSNSFEAKQTKIHESSSTSRQGVHVFIVYNICIRLIAMTVIDRLQKKKFAR